MVSHILTKFLNVHGALVITVYAGGVDAHGETT